MLLEPAAAPSNTFWKKAMSKALLQKFQQFQPNTNIPNTQHTQHKHTCNTINKLELSSVAFWLDLRVLHHTDVNVHGLVLVAMDAFMPVVA